MAGLAICDPPSAILIGFIAYRWLAYFAARFTLQRRIARAVRDF